MPACKGLDYACTENAECGADGVCEAEGWCSFPDERCESGRRYAEFSGGGLGGACVGVSPGTSSGDATTSAAASASTDPGAETTRAASSSTTGIEPPSSSSETGSDSSSSSTGGGPLPCEGWADAFDDGMIGAPWNVYGATGSGGHVMEEADGVLHWTFAPDIVEQRGVQAVLDSPLEGLRVQTASVSDLAEAQTVLLVRDPGNPPDLFLVWGNGLVEFRLGSETVAMDADVGWTDIHFEGGQARVSRSADGVSFEPFVDADVPTDPGGGLELFLYGQTWTEAPSTTEAAFERIQLCEP